MAYICLPTLVQFKVTMTTNTKRRRNIVSQLMKYFGKRSCNVHLTYWSSVLVRFPPVCYYYGLGEEHLFHNDEMKELRTMYATVLHICFSRKVKASHHFAGFLHILLKGERLISFLTLCHVKNNEIHVKIHICFFCLPPCSTSVIWETYNGLGMAYVLTQCQTINELDLTFTITDWTRKKMGVDRGSLVR